MGNLCTLLLILLNNYWNSKNKHLKNRKSYSKNKNKKLKKLTITPGIKYKIHNHTKEHTATLATMCQIESCPGDHTATQPGCQANNGSEMNSETLTYSKNMG